jgi:TrfB plasmid transcriptional repressor
MTHEQFILIARLLRSHKSTISAVRMVIFDKVANAEAARKVGSTPQAVHRSTKRFLALHEAIKRVYKK